MVCANSVAVARLACWLFYTIEIIYIFVSALYYWTQIGGEAIYVVDAMFYTIVFLLFGYLGYYSVMNKRDYFGSISDWATEIELKCMWMVCLPTGLMFRNWSSDPEVRDFSAEFECYFWKNYTIFKAATSFLNLILSLAQGNFFGAIFIVFLFAVYYWGFYTLTQNRKPSQNAAVDRANAEIYADPAEIQAAVPPNPSVAQAQPPPQKMEFEKIELTDSPAPVEIQSTNQVAVEITAPPETGTAENGVTYDRQGIIAPSNAVRDDSP